MKTSLLVTLLALTCLESSLRAQSGPEPPRIAPASEEAEIALKRFQLDEGLEVSLFAAEPRVAHPVAFTMDHRGRAFVVETFRLKAGVTDTRQHMYWLDDDLACRTVEDRVAMYRKHHGDEFESLYVGQDDRIRLIEDTDGDGRADRDTVFASGFTTAATGLGAGVLTRGSEVWYACIPDLWRLHDDDDDGVADRRESMHHGYGVHVGYLGHDLHGLIFGPDGRLYFSIGDRGSNVRTDDRHVYLPDTGAVFRCEPDGSDLQVFATGLRNPQELAFDDFGNLFTGENNSDSGDLARWVYLVEGSDSGWRMGFQYLTQPVSRGPWNAEKLWHPRHPGQPAYIVPPVANYSDGPSGLAHYPGTGLGERYRGEFFLCDFRGDYAHSGVRRLAVKPRGASFELEDRGRLIWSVLATDIEFGPDGAAYVSDWVQGWDLTTKGRIYRIQDPQAASSQIVREVKELLARGFGETPIPRLITLLDHADRRVRQESQFELARRDESARVALERATRADEPRLRRIHALWALGQIARRDPEVVSPLLGLAADSDLEVRAQLCRILADVRREEVVAPLTALLKDPSPRVRSLAALALGKQGRTGSIPALLEALSTNDDADAVIRHTCVMALSWIGDVPALLERTADPSRAIRRGVLLTLRRLRSPAIALFLDDADSELVDEAARAIYDLPIPPALPALARLGLRNALPEMTARRVVNALNRLDDAPGVAALATREDLTETVRLEALDILRTWESPRGRDRVVGAWRPLGPRPREAAVEALRPVLTGLLRADSAAVQARTLQTIRDLGVSRLADSLVSLASETSDRPQVQIEALRALASLDSPALAGALQASLTSPHAIVRAEARDLLVRVDPARAVTVLEKTLASGSRLEKQQALRSLGKLGTPPADAILAAWIDRLVTGELPPALALDVIEAAESRENPELRKRLETYREQGDADDPLTPFRSVLHGGDAERGRDLFRNHQQIYCIRCHRVGAEGGDVGPDLTTIAKDRDRPYLLASIVAPDLEVAEGFDSVMLIVKTGQVISGVVKSEDETSITLATGEAELVTVKKEDILMRARGASAMPAGLHERISRGELRDLVEYLASLDGE